MPHARVLTYGYDGLACLRLGNEHAISQVAWELLAALEAQRRLNPLRPLVYVAHGCGGLIIAELLRQSQSCEQSHLRVIFESTCSSIFFGTNFSDATQACRLTSVAAYDNNQKQQLTVASSWLRELRNNFEAAARERKWIVEFFLDQPVTANSDGQEVRCSVPVLLRY